MPSCPQQYRRNSDVHTVHEDRRGFQVLEDESYDCQQRQETDWTKALELEIDTFHRRRILCVLEMFFHIDLSGLVSDAEGLEHYWQILRAYAEQKTDAKQVQEMVDHVKKSIDWESLKEPQFSLVPELTSFWCGEDVLDWSYSQYFEIMAGNLRKFIASEIVIEILNEHFPDVMAEPVRQLISTKE